MMKRLLVVSCLAMSLMASGQAFAGSDAGCGLGSMIFQKNSVLSQTLAGTTNMSSYTQFFGLTSGTSNCKASGFVQNEKKDVYFAEANFDNLAIEMSKGEGESLQAFAQVLGCGADSLADFGAMTRGNYSKILPSADTNAVQMLNNVKSELKAHPSLSKHCAQVG